MFVALPASERRRTVRNLIIFTAVALSSGGVGAYIDTLVPPQAEEDTLGMAFWLVLPLIAVILLRSFAGDGWKDGGFAPRFRGNLGWYAGALFIFPAVTAVASGTGAAAGVIRFEGFEAGAYFRLLVGLFFINLLKNFFEESVWRGYLTAKLVRLKLSDIKIYLIAGMVWGLWHVPYYLIFLEEETVRSILPVEPLLFAIFAVLHMIVWTVMFTELFRITQSVWSVVLLHASEDATVNHLIIDGHITFSSGGEWIFSPVCGLVPGALYLGIGLWMRKRRMAKAEM